MAAQRGAKPRSGALREKHVHNRATGSERSDGRGQWQWQQRRQRQRQRNNGEVPAADGCATMHSADSFDPPVDSPGPQKDENPQVE